MDQLKCSSEEGGQFPKSMPRSKISTKPYSETNGTAGQLMTSYLSNFKFFSLIDAK